MTDRAQPRAKIVNRLRALSRRASSAPAAEAQPAQQDDGVAAESYPLPAARPRRTTLTVAVAAGDRLRNGLAWEWNQLAIGPGGWRDELSAVRPEFLLIELARGAVPGWDQESLTRLLAWTRAEHVPVVVWVTNGADVPEVPSALIEDTELVLLHDPAAVGRWRERWPQASIEALPPAAQPRLHSPALGGPGDRRPAKGVLIVDDGGLDAGAVDALTEIVAPGLKPVKSADFDVWTRGDQPGDQLAGVRAKVRGTCGYERSIALSGEYRVLLDAGRSNAGASWSLLEAGAAQTAVVTLPDHRAALPAELAEQVAAASDGKSLRGELMARICQPELRDREGLRLHRAVLAGHTYGHRVERILAGLGRADTPVTKSVSAIAPTNREHEIGNILNNIGRQAYPDLELVLVLHGLDVKHAEVEAWATEAGVKNLTIVDADPSLTLGACMNLGIDAADGGYLAKIDDDNYYGAHYLTDLMACFEYTDAGIVGKWAHYVWLRSTDAVVLRYPDSEHTDERRIQGGTMLIDGDLARSKRFSDIPRAVDSDFLDRAIDDGVRIYSGDRFNFVSVRGSDRTSHTWQVHDVTFMTKTGRLAFFGDPRTHVEV